MNTIYDRLKEIRENKNMSQTEFADFIGIGRSTLGMMEVGKREILDRHIKMICSICNVSEEWLRNGIGEMFTQNDESVLAELTREYDLDSIQRLVIESILQMNDMERQVLKKFVHGLVDKALDKENYEEFRAGYIKENAAPAAARDGDISGIAEAAALYDAAMEDEDED